jgi:AraC family transcriptional regulator
MKIPIYRNSVDYLTPNTELNPYLLFAQKYEFFPGETSSIRRCYANAIVLMESGAGTLHIDMTEYSVQAGALVYIPAGTLHRWKSDHNDPMIHRCAYFDWYFIHRPAFHYQKDYFRRQKGFNDPNSSDGPFRKEWIAPMDRLQLNPISKVSNIPLWVSYFNGFTTHVEFLGEYHLSTSLKIRGAFQIFLHHFLEFAVKLASYSDPRIKKILDQIENEPLKQSEQKLYEWVSELGLGRSHFYSLFKAETGVSPKAYLKQIRLTHILNDLCFSILSITHIAEKYGYPSIHYFSRSFRTMTGVTPSEYRKKYR